MFTLFCSYYPFIDLYVSYGVWVINSRFNFEKSGIFQFWFAVWDWPEWVIDYCLTLTLTQENSRFTGNRLRRAFESEFATWRANNIKKRYPGQTRHFFHPLRSIHIRADLRGSVLWQKVYSTSYKFGLFTYAGGTELMVIYCISVMTRFDTWRDKLTERFHH